MPGQPTLSRLLSPLIALTGWFALGVQFALTLGSSLAHHTGVLAGLLVFFGFFTNLTNLLLALAQTALWLTPQSRAGRYAADASVQTGLLINMLLVGIVYEALLRGLWTPSHWEALADDLLHDVQPPLCLLYWFVAVPRVGLPWTAIPRWLVYPSLYLVYTLLHGLSTHHYPYGFLNAASNGYANTFGIALLLGLGLAVMGAALIAIDRAMAARQTE